MGQFDWICFHIWSLTHENSFAIWILYDQQDQTYFSCSHSIIQEMFWKVINCPERNPASASLLFMHSGGFIHPDYHQPIECNLAGTQVLWCWCVASTYRGDGMSDDSFTTGPQRRDRIRLQKFLWAQQWPSINKLAGFSTLDSAPTHLIAELQHTVCIQMNVFGRFRGSLAMKGLPWTALSWCDLQNMHMLQKKKKKKLHFHEAIMTQRK